MAHVMRKRRLLTFISTVFFAIMRVIFYRHKIHEVSFLHFRLQLEEYTSATHVGTHMDAPCNLALRKWCVDEIPLERLAAPAAVVDITEKAESNPDAMVDINDLKRWEDISLRSLNGTIVILRTGWGRRWNNKTSFIGTSGNDTSRFHFPGMSPDAAQWLVNNRDIYGVATETVSLDHGKSRDFRAHRILLAANIYGLENVANVEEIPIVGAFIHAMPMKIGRASGAPTRIVARYPKVIVKPKQDTKSANDRGLREVIIFSK